MDNLPDYSLRKSTSERPGSSPGPPVGWWIAAVAVIAAVVVGAYFFFGRRPAAPAATPPEAETSTPAPAPQPLGGPAQAADVPPLDESDAFVRQLVSGLSAHPVVSAWLATNGLIRNFVVVVENIAEGTTPAVHLQALRPKGGFQTIERNGQTYLDPKSYDRYNGLADAVSSVDAAGAASLYTTLKPRIEQAYGDLGFPNRPFDRALEQAIVRLLDTPVVDGPVRLTPKGIGYGFADQQLEALTPAQKQLFRMGPRNIRIVKEKLREVGVALGIPAERLEGRS